MPSNAWLSWSLDFNPPSPCGEGRFRRGAHGVGIAISIHPPRVGRDITANVFMTDARVFQSTLPVWGGTCTAIAAALKTSISIHPPRVGRDHCKIWRI